MAGDINFTIEKAVNQEGLELISRGDIELNDVPVFRQQLLQYINDYDHVRVSIKAFSDVNPGFIQVLIALKNMPGKTVELFLEMDQEKLKVLEHSGLSEYFENIRTS